MRRFFVALPIATLALTGWAQSSQAAQESKARGSLVDMAANSITVKVGNTDMRFSVDATTVVEAPGGSTKMRAAAAKGQPGPKLADVLKVGDAVEVSYSDAAGKHATSIRKIGSPGSGGVPAKTASGTVTAVSASSLSIDGSGGGGSKFSQTYALDEKTVIVARGATKATKGSGHGSATDLIAKGDHVSVSFEDAGGTLRASEVRVTVKAAVK